MRYKDLLDDVYSDISNLLKSSGNVCSIIYCLERAACDDLSMHLSQQGVSSAGMLIKVIISTQLQVVARLLHWNSSDVIMYFTLIAYHAGLNSKVRSSVLDDWLSSRTQVVVATVAFGYCFSSVLFVSFQSFGCWFLVLKFQRMHITISCICSHL